MFLTANSNNFAASKYAFPEYNLIPISVNSVFKFGFNSAAFVKSDTASLNLHAARSSAATMPVSSGVEDSRGGIVNPWGGLEGRKQLKPRLRRGGPPSPYKSWGGPPAPISAGASVLP